MSDWKFITNRTHPVTTAQALYKPKGKGIRPFVQSVKTKTEVLVGRQLSDEEFEAIMAEYTRLFVDQETE